MYTVLSRWTRWRVAVMLACVSALALIVQAFGGFSPARADADGTHPSGTFSFSGKLLVGCPTGAVLCSQGSMTGGLNGDFTMTILTLLPSADAGVSFFTGYLVLHTANGDLRCTLDGATNASTSSEGEFGEICVIHGGTGSYAHARGDLRMTGTSTSTLLIPTGAGTFQGLVRTS